MQGPLNESEGVRGGGGGWLLGACSCSLFSLSESDWLGGRVTEPSYGPNDGRRGTEAAVGELGPGSLGDADEATGSDC